MAEGRSAEDADRFLDELEAGDPSSTDSSAADRPACPERPASDDPAALGFTRRPMVRWLDPHQLVDTAGAVVVSGVFSSYADNRELQSLQPAEVFDRSDAPELWLDYVADLGDGWNSTYSVASLLAAEELKLEWEGEAVATERGRISIMGGDQVYPVPKHTEYENRLLGPYRSALPCPPAGADAPELFAIPGSHDWYDGLVNFTSIFCRNRWVGGWRTRQRRSYFALALPGGWWLWGVDIQFGYLTQALIEYFAGVARDRLKEGDRIVLCMAKEVESGRSDEETHSDRERRLPGPGGDPAERRRAHRVPQERQAPLRPLLSSRTDLHPAQRAARALTPACRAARALHPAQRAARALHPCSEGRSGPRQHITAGGGGRLPGPDPRPP